MYEYKKKKTEIKNRIKASAPAGSRPSSGFVVGEKVWFGMHNNYIACGLVQKIVQTYIPETQKWDTALHILVEGSGIYALNPKDVNKMP